MASHGLLRFTEDQELLRSSVRSYLEREIAPQIAECEREHRFPFDQLPELVQLGYVSGIVPEEHGGGGASFTDQAVLMEEAGRCWASLRVIMNTMTIVSLWLTQYGTKEQKENYLARIMAGQAKVFLALTSPDHGSDLASMTARAEKVPGGYKLYGTKTFITSGSIADFGIVFAKTDTSKGREGISAFIVERGVTPYTAHDMEKMFIRSTTTSELSFDGAFVPDSARVGEEGQAMRIATHGLNIGRLDVACGSAGLAGAAFERSLQYAKDRHQFGRPIGSFQLVQEMLVTMACLTETARLHSYQAAAVLDAGQSGEMACSMAKMISTENAFRVADLALQVHGGSGYMEELPIERYFRDARGFTIPEGTSQIQQLIIGRELTGINAMR
ncbi:acyl-CoA dehydrogenase family protein [Kitasatospora paranensis]|uniref:Acyl-CoA dehydrogenase family protein n=1 Tax=Kitasatospora paranensis TaxID=258053 RepID=A0ABW2FWC4_9ACTN